MKFCVIILVFITLFSSLSCGDADKILAAFEGTTELSQGARVPFLLSQNFPNPFNPTTLIHFDVATTMHLRLSVWTDDWHEVAVPFEQDVTPATYEIFFRADNLASGEYYYMLEGGNHRQIRKMKLAK